LLFPFFPPLWRGCRSVYSSTSASAWGPFSHLLIDNKLLSLSISFSSSSSSFCHELLTCAACLRNTTQVSRQASRTHASTTRFTRSPGLNKYGHPLSSSPLAGALPCTRATAACPRPPPLPRPPQPGVRAHGKCQRKLLRQRMPPPDAGAALENEFMPSYCQTRFTLCV